MEWLAPIIDKLLNEAQLAANHGDIPVAAALLNNQYELIAIAHNNKELNSIVSGHAEINVINKVSQLINNNYLNDYILVTTLEPCKMCFYAIVESRIKQVIYLAKDTKKGALSSLMSLIDKVNPKELPKFLYHEYLPASLIIKNFFKKLR